MRRFVLFLFFALSWGVQAGEVHVPSRPAIVWGVLDGPAFWRGWTNSPLLHTLGFPMLSANTRAFFASIEGSPFSLPFTTAAGHAHSWVVMAPPVSRAELPASWFGRFYFAPRSQPVSSVPGLACLYQDRSLLVASRSNLFATVSGAWRFPALGPTARSYLIPHAQFFFWVDFRWLVSSRSRCFDPAWSMALQQACPNLKGVLVSGAFLPDGTHVRVDLVCDGTPVGLVSNLAPSGTDCHFPGTIPLNVMGATCLDVPLEPLAHGFTRLLWGPGFLSQPLFVRSDHVGTVSIQAGLVRFLGDRFIFYRFHPHGYSSSALLHCPEALFVGSPHPHQLLTGVKAALAKFCAGSVVVMPKTFSGLDGFELDSRDPSFILPVGGRTCFVAAAPTGLWVVSDAALFGRVLSPKGASIAKSHVLAKAFLVVHAGNAGGLSVASQRAEFRVWWDLLGRLSPSTVGLRYPGFTLPIPSFLRLPPEGFARLVPYLNYSVSAFSLRSQALQWDYFSPVASVAH